MNSFSKNYKGLKCPKERESIKKKSDITKELISTHKYYSNEKWWTIDQFNDMKESPKYSDQKKKVHTIW